MLISKAPQPTVTGTPAPRGNANAGRFAPAPAVAITLHEGDYSNGAGIMFGVRMALATILCTGCGVATAATATSLPPAMLQAPGTTSGNLATVQRRRRFDSVPQVLSHIKKRALLNWGELAEILAVSRRTIHFWSSGGSITPDNRAKLEDLYEQVEGIDRGRSHETRRELLKRYGIVAPPRQLGRREVINRGPILEVGAEIEVPMKRVSKTYRRAQSKA